MGRAWVVVRDTAPESDGVDEPMELGGDGWVRGKKDDYVRWYDSLDDATWFVHRLDAEAFALIVDAHVTEAPWGIEIPRVYWSAGTSR